MDCISYYILIILFLICCFYVVLLTCCYTLEPICRINMGYLKKIHKSLVLCPCNTVQPQYVQVQHLQCPWVQLSLWMPMDTEAHIKSILSDRRRSQKLWVFETKNRTGKGHRLLRGKFLFLKYF